MAEFMLWLVIAFVIYELFEHVLFPLAWAVRDWRRGRPSALEQLIGLDAEVLTWDKGQGQVLVKGERWLAQGPVELASGKPVKIIEFNGLILTVKPTNS
jgi:membrane-bound serine protease (ClpP class)